MSGDYSRYTHRPKKRFSELLMQQGRVQLDSDWNELMKIIARRWNTQALDTFGPSAVPRETSSTGFDINFIAGPDLSIGKGRIYVDGLLAEIFPDEDWKYSKQPFFSAPKIADFGAGPVLAYLDVWQREVTAIQDRELLETALGGPDTTTRVQTVWQLKLADKKALQTDPSCSVDLDAVFPRSAGRLSSDATKAPATTDPCLLPEQSGYRGIENRNYRVEVHTGGTIAQARFKWSRESGSIVSRVEKLKTTTVTTLVADRIGLDSVLRFAKEDWVEVIDDELELAGLPGEMAKVAKVTEATREIELDRLLPAGKFDPQKPERHTRVRRWDQRDGVDGNGLISIPNPAAPIPLEAGIEVTLELDQTIANGKFHTGDYWTFAARVADASVEKLVKEPPRGIVHHYAPLATLTNLGAANPGKTDCRTLWPPLVEAGEGCECTVCVTQESHDSGKMTIQMAVEKAKEARGGKICLEVGTYLVHKPIQITDAEHIEIRGRGKATFVVCAGLGATFVIERSKDISILGMRIGSTAGGERNLSVGVRMAAVQQVRIERCSLTAPKEEVFVTGDLLGEAGDPLGAGIELDGYCREVQIRDNWIAANFGIRTPPADARAADTALSSILIERNVLRCETAGVIITGGTVEAKFGVGVYEDLVVRENMIMHCTGGAIAVIGSVPLHSEVRIEDNELRVAGIGIMAAVERVRIGRNDIIGMPGRIRDELEACIVYAHPGGISCEIYGNHLHKLSGDGIMILGAARYVSITDNILLAIRGSGILVADDGGAEELVVENNVLQKIGNSDIERQICVAIGVQNAARARISRNIIAGVGEERRHGLFAGILVVGARTADISKNEVGEVDPSGHGPAVGIEVRKPVGGTIAVEGNRVQAADVYHQGPGDWRALTVGVPIAAERADDPLILYGEKKTYVLTNKKVAAYARDDEGALGIRGNTLDGRVTVGGLQTVRSCIFTSNQCQVIDRSDHQVAVHLEVDRVVAGDNIIVTHKELSLRIPTKTTTVVGNITSTSIETGNGVLPIDHLNMRG